MTGIELKVRRVGADISLKDIAAAMGVTDSRVSRIESSRVVTPEAEARYVAALDMCLTKSTTAQDGTAA